MTTNADEAAPDRVASAESLERLHENLRRMEQLSSRLVAAMARRRTVPAPLQGPGQDLFVKAAAAYMAEMVANPAKLLEHQISYWGKSLMHYVEAQQALARGPLAAPEDHTPADRRFANPLWQTHPWFNFLKQQYLLNAEAVESAVSHLDGLEPRERQRIEYFSRQILDLFSPSNFLGTNPEALEKAVATDGESLVKGLENLVRDIEANNGDLQVTLADRDAFTVGGNIATTEGAVVFRNRMFELIQYAPATETVHKIPLVIFPPWINKFYILDLKPQNSLVKWIVDQGFTLFVVSWKNPDPSSRDTGLGDYIEEGYLAAIEALKTITGQPRINAVGYCIAGTTLALTLALMKHRGDRSVASATFFTTLTDFSDPGEVGVFLSDDFIDGIEAEVRERGILSSFFMSRTFSYLRSNDLIYGPAIRSYMMGESPPAFDLLYWNGDGTNLPAKMAVEYLRGLCQANRFAEGGIELLGERLSLSDVTVPVCAIACETDHIAGWKQSYAGIRQMGAKEKTFILSGSGHIAGIVNPPSKQKYGHWLNDAWPERPEDWQEAARKAEGSWWPHWADWLAARSGAHVPARSAGSGDHPELAPAPGRYVVEQPAAE